MNNKSETNANTNPDVPVDVRADIPPKVCPDVRSDIRSEVCPGEHPIVMPDINPQEERVFTKRDILKMILGGYISLLPAFLALAAAFLLVYLFVR